MLIIAFFVSLVFWVTFIIVFGLLATVCLFLFLLLITIILMGD